MHFKPSNYTASKQIHNPILIKNIYIDRYYKKKKWNVKKKYILDCNAIKWNAIKYKFLVDISDILVHKQHVKSKNGDWFENKTKPRQKQQKV